MFEAKGRVEIFKRIVEVISVIVSEVKYSIKEDGLHIKAVDPAHVAMVELNISPKAFGEYSASDTELGIDLDKLDSIIKLGKGNDEAEMVYDESSERLVVKIGNLVRRMTLLDVASMPDLKIPNLQFPARIELLSDDLLLGVRAAQSVGDYVVLTADSESFELSAGTQEEINQKLSKDQLSLLECKGKARSLFSLDYLSSLAKGMRSGEKLTLLLGNDYPVRIEFDILEGNGSVAYLLAPRTEIE
jgi:proliferating cell nuclear antigen